MEITSKNIKRWSTLGARPTFGLEMVDLAQRYDNLMVLTADVSTSAGLERYKKAFPEKFLDVGIAEQNMMGIATGLAKEGFRVVTTSFAPFQTMRCLEQIRVNQGYMKIPVVMVGLASGIYHSYLGNTHCCFEDAAILRSIPNIAVVTPADGVSMVKAVEEAIESPCAVYIRLIENQGLPVVYDSDISFQIGKAITVKEGHEVALLANGTMVSVAKTVSDILEKEGLTVKIVDFHTLKPLDRDMLDQLMDFKLIVTMEEHNVIGGLGSAVAEYLMKKRDYRPQQLMAGISDFYPHAGSYESALEQCGLTPEQIADRVLKELGV